MLVVKPTKIKKEEYDKVLLTFMEKDYNYYDYP
jgi:hypothetical protein